VTSGTGGHCWRMRERQELSGPLGRALIRIESQRSLSVIAGDIELRTERQELSGPLGRALIRIESQRSLSGIAELRAERQGQLSDQRDCRTKSGGI
jgi:hypothetical protein